MLRRVRKIAARKRSRKRHTSLPSMKQEEIQYKPMRVCDREQSYRKCSDEIKCDSGNLRPGELQGTYRGGILRTTYVLFVVDVSDMPRLGVK